MFPFHDALSATSFVPKQTKWHHDNWNKIILKTDIMLENFNFYGEQENPNDSLKNVSNNVYFKNVFTFLFNLIAMFKKCSIFPVVNLFLLHRH